MSSPINISIQKERIVKFTEGLKRYLPEKALQPTVNLLSPLPIYLKITKNRKSKLGDFRAAHGGKPHVITINHNLNHYSFLITLVHEIAHYKCWVNHKHKVKPHGEEWKNEFKNCMGIYFELKIFPDDISSILEKYMGNPMASSCTDLNLVRVLRKYDLDQGLVFLEDLPAQSIFTLNNKRLFVKGEKRRKLYKCQDLNTKKIYLINPLCEVSLFSHTSTEDPLISTFN